MRLPPRLTWPDGVVLAAAWDLPLVECHEVLGSTQDRALELARAGSPDWTAVVAEHQSQGRGRRGQRWESARGLGLWLSLVLPPDPPQRLTDVPTLPVPLRLGAALADVIDRALPESSVGVKWPNDVWVAGKKVAGVLAERVGPHTIAGLGLNLYQQPENLSENVRSGATSLSIEGWAGDPVALVGSLVSQVKSSLSQSGVEVLARLRPRDVLLGRLLTTPDGRAARGAGIDEEGALRVCAGEEEWRVCAGSVVLSESSVVESAINQE